jgi:hypothetical protein
MSKISDTVFGWRHALLTTAKNAQWYWRGLHRLETADVSTFEQQPLTPNALHSYFENVRTGPGVWKWEHYFEVYDRHFSKFRNRPMNVLEIGIYSGGSLGMWRDYFGPQCTVYGVDIEESCKLYERDGVRVFIGDQADRDFWSRLKREVPPIDIIIDDGGHEPVQMLVTFEELFPHLNPGGVYLCEDIHGKFHRFSAYINGLSNQLNSSPLVEDFNNPERRIVAKATSFQGTVQSVHTYPFIAIVEKRSAQIKEFVAPKRGTQWQPFMK